MQQAIRVPPCAPARLVLLASGTGSLLQSVLAAAVGDYPARVIAVGTDRDCAAADVAAAAGVPVFTARLRDHANREAWDAALTAATVSHQPDLVVSAGFMKYLDRIFFRAFPVGCSILIRRCCLHSRGHTRCPMRWSTACA